MAVSVGCAVIFLLLFNLPDPNWPLRFALWITCGGALGAMIALTAQSGGRPSTMSALVFCGTAFLSMSAAMALGLFG